MHSYKNHLVRIRLEIAKPNLKVFNRLQNLSNFSIKIKSESKPNACFFTK